MLSVIFLETKQKYEETTIWQRSSELSISSVISFNYF